ncbi:MAG TPA: DUF3035 domain-containing protein [Caulobacteraceae bacterium]|nr:DUF3035 domain-containing protein [Caulobacteraceae bacterium]
MVRDKVVAALVLTAAAGILASCQSASRALGMSKISPNEFLVVSKAPLVLPPDYSLRPPAPGEPRPQELEPESAARQALLGQSENAIQDEGERLLVSKAGGDKADPLIRYVVDDQFGNLAHKDAGFARWVMFWRKGQPPSEAAQASAAANASNPVNASVEAQRIKELTGDRPVVIARRPDSKIKLPGL